MTEQEIYTTVAVPRRGPADGRTALPVRRADRRRGAAGAAALAAATALLLPTAGCRAELPDQGFVLRYEKPAAADRDGSRFLKDRALAESTLADLNAYVDLPYRVTVVARSCAGEGSGYDPAGHRIELCYDDLAEERELFERGESRNPDEDLSEVVRETLLHEAGHALVDALDLPDEGERAEEDAADRFAQLMLLRGDPEGEGTLLTAARAYDLAAAADPTPDPADEHAPPATRAESHRCAVYGASPARHPDLATPSRTDCAATWTRTRDAWLKDLEPLLRA
ncbi:DUF4344 domain-containing metallopeptidase [Streptomyces sp. NBC_01408]|uniref:DUF4344 domain-containing metallopeptidase n=1 Tax=Streptomyces sp. NBC_01408 TaxID=2903855 RepID=UPI0022539914|nr:DUF4344 domain-containing metallopeptidase [Streptomyces sp. NBC_01408]MCX4691340.1 DUF4344 domain-containing metallopeptidase [Streptomyces sp. NBC_01408]